MQVLYETPELIDESKSLRGILDSLVLEKMEPHGTDEPMALKLHYISCILDQTAKAKAASKDGTGKAFLKK